MARIDELRKQLVGNVFCSDDIDQALEKYDFYPVEVEDDEERNILNIPIKNRRSGCITVRMEKIILLKR